MSNVQKAPGDEGLRQKLNNAVHSVVNPDTKSHISTTNRYKEHPSKQMRAAEWHGTQDIRVVTRPAPTVTEPTDCVVRVTNSTVCGSDLHMYYNEVPGVQVMQKGDIPGHESVGVIEEVGSSVTDFKVGDRVVISAVISCGKCEQCLKQNFSACDTTNPSGEMEQLYGHRCAALFGYSHLAGGYAGCQAELVRVPFANVNLFKIPDGVSDESVLSLADIMCTGWHGNELAAVKKGDTVAVWGCGPVGLCAQMGAIARGAKMVIGIDNDETRLAMCAKTGAVPVNFDKEKDVFKAVTDRIPGGPDCCIDCVGYRMPKSWSHYFQRKLKLETDCCEVVNECIMCCRKNGHIALIGDYFNFTNGFRIGNFMEKGLTMSGGQLLAQKYIPTLLKMIQEQKLNPLIYYTHRMPFSEIGAAYKMFGARDDNCVKVILKTDFGIEQEQKRGEYKGMGKIAINM